jgi:carbon monoxide dehydrogenase subunit G
MKVSGTHSFNAPVDDVWRAINDPAVLARTLPGCESLTELGPDSYAMRVTAGVAAIKGTYEGTVALADKQEPSSFTMNAKGAGAPGTIAADVRVALASAATGGTDLSYDADAVVGGVIGGVGQRMLVGVTRKMAGEFFKAIDADIANGGTVAVASGARPIEPVGTSVPPVASSGGVGTVYAGAPARSSGGGMRDHGFALGALAGGVIALAGVLVGWAIGGR